MLTFGIVLTTLGAVLPDIVDKFRIDKAQAGSLFLLMTSGILATSLVFGPMVDRYGYKGMLLVATALISIGLLTMAFAESLLVLRMAVVLIGAGGGIVNGGTNTLVADISSEEKGASLNLLGVFFGIGAVGVPFLLATMGTQLSNNTLVSLVGLFVLIPFILIAKTSFPAPKQAQGFPITAARRLARDPFLLLTGFMLFLESGMEISVGGWTSTFVNEVLSVSARVSLIVLSLYWMGMLLARLVLGTILRTIPPVRLLYTCLSIALTGALILLMARSAVASALGVFMLGVGFSATVPTILGMVGERYADLSGTAFSFVIAIALLGGTLFPWIMGILGGSYGMRGSFIVVPIAILLLAALLTVLRRAQERHSGRHLHRARAGG